MDAHVMPSFQIGREGKDCCHTSGLYVRPTASVPDGIRRLGLYQQNVLDVLGFYRVSPVTV